MFDFGEEWRQLAKLRRRPDSVDHWDKRARDEVAKFAPSEYSDKFLDRAGLQPGESLFDMGCGAGTLAIPAALRGHRVLACDFSAVMLERLRAGAPADCADRIETKQLAWADDWEAAGVVPRSYDVACASRSIITDDLEDSLHKLTGVARRRACVTVTAGMSPRVFPALFADLGLEGRGHQDAAFVFGVLSSAGYEPAVSFIHSTRYDRFASFDEAYRTYCKMLEFAIEPPEGAARVQAQAGVRAWLQQHLQRDEGRGASADEIRAWTRQDAQGVAHVLPYRVDVPRRFSWAFIAWDVERG